MSNFEETLESTTFPLDAEVIATEIGVPVSNWPGNCAAIAKAIFDFFPIEGMKLCRGHIHARAHKDSVFRGEVHQHSWLELADGRILDPTRWTINSPHKPSIFLGLNSELEYDEYSQSLNDNVRLAQRSSISSLLSTNTDQMRGLLQKIGAAEWRILFEREKPESLGDSAVRRFGDVLMDLKAELPEKLENAAEIYGAFERCGLRGLLQIDKWVTVMEPEKVFVQSNRNFYYEAEEIPSEERTDAYILDRIFNKFLCVEDRGCESFERELEELGYSLEEFWDALNSFHKAIDRYDGDWSAPDFKYGVGTQEMNTIAVVCADLLGSGYGKSLEVERFARTYGWTPQKLNDVLSDFGNVVGYDLAFY